MAIPILRYMAFFSLNEKRRVISKLINSQLISYYLFPVANRQVTAYSHQVIFIPFLTTVRFLVIIRWELLDIG